MFKNQSISKLILLVLLLVLTFASCDGRHRKYKTNTKNLEQNNPLISFNEHTTFLPKQDLKIVTDTIMNNGFQIKINYNTVGRYNVLKVKNEKLNQAFNVHYKNFEAKLYVLNKGKVINDSIVNKKLFHEFETPQFWNNAIMQHLWVDYQASTEDQLILKTAFNIPNTEIYKDFVLKIDKRGLIKIEQKQLS